jgi:hexokinase
MRRSRPVWFYDLEARLSRIEHNQHVIMRVLLRTESEVIMAYEAELAAAEAAAKANDDAEDAAEGLFSKLAEIIAALKAGNTDPATAARIQSLADALTARAAQLSAAVVAGTPSA